MHKPVLQEVDIAAASGNNAGALLPVLLNAEDINVLIVGGGIDAYKELAALIKLAPQLQVFVIAPTVSVHIKGLATQHPGITICLKEFEAVDLAGVQLVICAVPDENNCALIATLAKEKGILLNIAGSPEGSDFYIGTPLKNRFANERSVKEWRTKKIATYALIAFGFMLVGHFIFSYIPVKEATEGIGDWYSTLDKNFHWMVLAGFLAQLIDGALGMGYGVTSATILLSAGVSPASISGSIHTAEMFASGASGYSHYKFGNVNKKLFKALVIPGVLGSILGAVLLTKFGDSHADYLRPAMAVYTLFLGLKIIGNAFRKPKPQKKIKRFSLLAGAGGFLDSFGGGGWGPIVTTTLITRGRSPKYVIGSVSLTEFFVTFASAFTFFTLLGVTHWQVILALIIGGLAAAPIAARLTGKLPRKTSFILLGVLVIIWSCRILIKVL